MEKERVLVLEDDPSLRYVIAEILRDVGYTVECAENGLEALEHVRRHMPKVILLDLQMPHLDGSGFVRSFRAEHDGAVPIVIMSAARDAPERALELGAASFLAKPFELDELLRTVVRARGEAGRSPE